MGSLWDWGFPPEFVERFPIFVETGYGTGNGLERAVGHAFKKIYSIEIWPEAVKHGEEKFRGDDRVKIIQDDSPMGIIEMLSRPEGNMFFWLDAHFPGADCFGQSFNYPDEGVRLPLERELGLIRKFCRNDFTILIDDLRYYGNLPWEEGPANGPAAEAMGGDRSLGFLTWFCATHDVQIFLNGKGFALISPRGAPQLRFIG